MKKRNILIRKFREYFMLDIGLDEFLLSGESNLKEDITLDKIIEEFRER